MKRLTGLAALALLTPVLTGIGPFAAPIALSEHAPQRARTADTTSVTREAGVSDEQVLFGQSAAFTGPAQELGQDMRRGIQAAFHEINRRGGVLGRQLNLVSLDDAYEPEAAIRNTLQLIEEDRKSVV